MGKEESGHPQHVYGVFTGIPVNFWASSLALLVGSRLAAAVRRALHLGLTPQK